MGAHKEMFTLARLASNCGFTLVSAILHSLDERKNYPMRTLARHIRYLHIHGCELLLSLVLRLHGQMLLLRARIASSKKKLNLWWQI